MIRAVTTVLSRPKYAGLAVLVVFGLFLFVSWFPNRELLRFAISSETISFWKLVSYSPQFFVTNSTLVSASITAVVIALSGVNIAMLAYYLQWRITNERKAGIGTIGTLIGLMGVGCAACGSVVLSSIFGLSVAAGFLGFLPFGGIELGVLGAVVLLVSIALLGKKIINPALCKITT